MLYLKSQNSFTLVELLITIAILAVLSTAVLTILNPQEYLRQSRDSQRLKDLTILSKIISWFETDTGGKGFMGTSSIVYVSIPDTTSTCANLGLPPLPSPWQYRCTTAQNLQKIDGTGWIPIDFNQLSFGRTLSKLPIDPINTTSSGNYYTYVTGGSF
ncbi:MAG: prepilin-type N-terminal cleavage/methylation domain-containing protein, partial [Patescibacteria group bacterium]|nr:prepilin-type N-terminal cleavage/methylation domain-containing protein [Patescibacteria group bacterium]